MTRHAHHHSDYLDLWLRFFYCSLCAEEISVQQSVGTVLILETREECGRRGASLSGGSQIRFLFTRFNEEIS